MALAEKLGIPKEAFAQTMKTYAESYKNKKDAEFGRVSLPEPLTTGKLYAIDVVPAIGGTLGGLSVDTDLRVLDEKGKPIPSLFAAGEVVGGWHGDDRYGGNAVAGNIVFGKRAARSAIKSLE
jgi:fumarate reductase flavoprotein subunit